MHLSTQTVLDLIEGRLETDQHTFWMQHLDFCKECNLEVAKVSQFKTDLKRSHLTSAAPQDLENAFQLFQAQPEEAKSTFRQVLAGIIFDSFMQPNFAGARRAATQAGKSSRTLRRREGS